MEAVDPGKEILERISALEVQRARIEAETASLMLQHADLRRAEADRNTDPRRRDLEASFAADELGIALRQPTKTVQDRLAGTRRVRGLLPLTWLAFGRGQVDAYRVSLIGAAVAKVRGDNHAIIELDHVISGKAGTQTTAQLKAWLRRFIAKNAPDTRAARAERDKRGVWVNHGDDGMSYLNAYLPAADAARIIADLTAAAKTLPTDGRTLDHKRADLLVDWLRTTGDTGGGHGTSSRAVIAITVPVTTLTGWDDAPGESFDGSFTIPADAVRDLATRPGTLFHRIFTDPLGRILDITELGRFPSTRLKTAIDIRDGTCLFPTCTTPAIESDKDHKVPHPRGPTAGSNLRALCRRHHQMKTHHITEPTAHTMSTPAPSRAERDLATWLVNIHYAA